MTHIPSDPTRWYSAPQWHPTRILCWTLRNRWYQLYCPWVKRSFRELIPPQSCLWLEERGREYPDTYVTERQRELLLRAIDASATLSAPMVEIGSYRGVTTRALAEHTTRLLYAVDPFVGYGGCEQDFEVLQNAIRGATNIKHLRQPSGTAFKALALQGQRMSFAFIDARHDYLNTWFDFHAWASLILPGGYIGLHDVDDHPGVNLVCQRILLGYPEFMPWAYCPNLLVFKKKGQTS